MNHMRELFRLQSIVTKTETFKTKLCFNMRDWIIRVVLRALNLAFAGWGFRMIMIDKPVAGFVFLIIATIMIDAYSAFTE